MEKNTKKAVNTKKVADLSEGAKTALAMLQQNPKGLTVADMKEKGFSANASHLKALKDRGLATSHEVEIEVVVTQKRKVQKYFVISAETTEPTE